MKGKGALGLINGRRGNGVLEPYSVLGKGCERTAKSSPFAAFNLP